MSEHRMSATELLVVQRAGMMAEVLTRFGITIETREDGGITVRKKPQGTRCFWCGEMIIQPGDESNRDAITQHTNNCDKNPLVQEVQALRAAARNVIRWKAAELLPEGMAPTMDELDAALHTIYDGGETDGYT